MAIRGLYPSDDCSVHAITNLHWAVELERLLAAKFSLILNVHGSYESFCFSIQERSPRKSSELRICKRSSVFRFPNTVHLYESKFVLGIRF